MADIPSIDLADWYPLVAPLVPTPRTEILRVDYDYYELYDGVAGWWGSFIADLTEVAGRIGYPLFLRTGHGSGKHEWKNTCCVTDERSLMQHASELISWSHTVDMFGLPITSWVAREMLDVMPRFHAFQGMPVGRERRWWIEDGQVKGWHPYWPPEAMTNVPDGWESALADLNGPMDGELHQLQAMTQRVADVVPGSWSVDWMYARRGLEEPKWWLIDMAHAKRSWIWAEEMQLI